LISTPLDPTLVPPLPPQVFFDSDPQAHAPFYFYLARLGLARVVTGQLRLEVGWGGWWVGRQTGWR
jgi:hypothetical protein